MTRLKLIIYCITSALFLSSCSEILEPVSLLGGSQDIRLEAGQEEFEINIKNLTFDTAKEANNATYSRRMVLTGSGSKANVIDEADFLKSNFPKLSKSPKYLLGIGDKVSLIQLNEFVTKPARWPSVSNEPEYILGVGDELAFTQSNESATTFNIEGKLVSTKNNDTLITTQGVIGSNGNVLLFGLGNILAANRTLKDIRTEIRNILIRNGLTPNFQLEINTFRSKKAFVTIGKE